MDKILYFPYISIPKSKWLMQTLLYWDEIASIVPLEYINKPESLPLHTRELLSNGLLTQIFPEEHIYNIKGFGETFIQYLESDSEIAARIKNLNTQNHDNYTDMVHVGKLSNIGKYLVDHNLAKRHNERWFKVEPYTAQAFMSYLAVLLGNETGYIPSTDRNAGLSLINIQRETVHMDLNLRDILRQRVFDSIMPVPQDVKDFHSIFRFKDRYHDELRRYRNYIENFIMDLEFCPEHQAEERLSRFIDDAKNQINNISGHMKPLGRISFVTLCSIVSTVAHGVNALSDNDPSKLYFAIPGLLGTIHSVLKKNKKIMKQPLAYAAIVKTEYKEPRINLSTH